MVVFAFTCGYPPQFVASSGPSTAWSVPPGELGQKLQIVHGNNEVVSFFSVGANGDFFLRTDQTVCTPDRGGLVDWFLELPEAKSAHITLSDVEQFIFSPNPVGYFAKARGILFWDGLPGEMEEDIRRHAGMSGVEVASVGSGGKWVVVHGDGSVSWDRVGYAVEGQLRNKGTKGVKFITLSQEVDDYYFIEYTDGSAAYNFPMEWKREVDEQIMRSAQQPQTMSQLEMINHQAALQQAQAMTDRIYNRISNISF